jgi:hypothetical protein
MSKKIMFTVCSANRIYQAKAMVKSFVEHNSDYTTVLCLADKINGRFTNKDCHPFHTIIEMDDLGEPELAGMIDRYSIFELSCALKSFFAKHLFTQYQATQLIYFDTDILVMDSMQAVELALQTNDIILTQHITKPFDRQEVGPNEMAIINCGLYNGGFFALKNSINSIDFLNWWANRLLHYGYNNPIQGLFVDQNWLNLVPIFFNGVHIAKHAGLNLAYWNFHERTITKNGTNYFANEQPVIFVHMSGYNIHVPEVLSPYQGKYNLADLPIVKELYAIYIAYHQQEDIDLFEPLIYYYTKPYIKPPFSFRRFLNRGLAKFSMELVKHKD